MDGEERTVHVWLVHLVPSVPFVLLIFVVVIYDILEYRLDILMR